MRRAFRIIVADRNPHVGKLLARELIGEGYQVQMVKDGRELLEMIAGRVPAELLILDLELPFVGGLEILEAMEQHQATLPVIVHTFQSEVTTHSALKWVNALVEKTGNHMERFKSVVSEVLRKNYPDRFLAGKQGAQAELEEPGGAGPTLETRSDI
jgi:DNA-binding NtrC family response regulator